MEVFAGFEGADSLVCGCVRMGSTPSVDAVLGADGMRAVDMWGFGFGLTVGFLE